MANIRGRLDRLESSAGVQTKRLICCEAALSTSEAERERFLHEAVADVSRNDLVVWTTRLSEDRPPRLISVTGT